MNKVIKIGFSPIKTIGCILQSGDTSIMNLCSVILPTSISLWLYNSFFLGLWVLHKLITVWAGRNCTVLENVRYSVGIVWDGRDVTSLLSDTLGISRNLCSKAYRDMGKFLECCYRCSFSFQFFFSFAMS